MHNFNEHNDFKNSDNQLKMINSTTINTDWNYGMVLRASSLEIEQKTGRCDNAMPISNQQKYVTKTEDSALRIRFIILEFIILKIFLNVEFLGGVVLGAKSQHRF